MKKSVLILFILLANWQAAPAQDFLLEYVEENYKETQAEFSYRPLIYHSIQVNSTAGPKMLILGGNNYNYRKWLRYYISKNKQFILKIDQNQLDNFVSSKVFKTDVTTLHPFNKNKWYSGAIAISESNALKGKNYFLVVDTNNTRNELFRTIAEKMGYRSVFYKTGEEAFNVFKLQPEKFKLIAIYHSNSGMPAEKVVEKIISVKHNVPILINTGYRNKKRKDNFKTKFSAFKFVHIKPVILKNLQKTIKTLLNKV
ncbi:MAG: response regulator [Desulfobacula sp.]|nr:response regulator [Desulfobacula sp.]